MAAPTAGSSRPPSSNGVIPAEWPAQAADTIVETIGKVRDKTTKPALTAARAVVYGLLGGIVGIIALVLLLVLIARLYENYVPGDIWPLYAFLAVATIVPGVLLLKRATRPVAAATV